VKIVLNRCAGGAFRLSSEALKRMRQLKGNLGSIKHQSRRDMFNVERVHQRLFHLEGSDELISRDDPVLVATVAELGDLASGHNAELEVVEIPEGVSWRIIDVIGIEYVDLDGGLHPKRQNAE
jgi:hypothetical protein